MVPPEQTPGRRYTDIMAVLAHPLWAGEDAQVLAWAYTGDGQGMPTACGAVRARWGRVLTLGALRGQVGVGRVQWVAPSGLVGLGPLAALGPVELGPGAAEGSSLHLPQARQAPGSAGLC